MDKDQKGINTVCAHTGAVEDKAYQGAISPLYMSTSYAYENVEVKRYPRYFNTPNQEMLAKKIAALEKAEDALIFGSGMAAISTSILAFLKAGDHVVFQNFLYGGTYNLICTQLEKFGIAYSFTSGNDLEDFNNAIQDNTKVVYIETPSNPLLHITDISGVASICKSRGLVSMIDNTFASPVNQNPCALGIDISIHSATKYMGGHSDICAGAVAASAAHIKKIHEMAICLGGSLSDYTVWLLERSLKTMGIRVKRQNENAMEMAQFLDAHHAVTRVYYPGLKAHPNYDLATSQMSGYGGMLSFEIDQNLNAEAFLRALRIIKPSMSLAGVESTILLPSKTSHALMSSEVRAEQGISDNLIRFSVGIEEAEDLKADLLYAFQKIGADQKSVNV